MATVAGPSKSNATARSDNFVEAQLDRARKRIRTLDVVTALLGLAAGTLAYAVVMALLDDWLTLPPPALYAAFVLYLMATVAYLAFTVVRPLRARINPYFAARQVELTLPGAKNSVVNWLDLHGDDTLSPAIQNAVAQRAARDLAKADFDKAISGRRAGWVGGAVAALVLVFLGLLFALGGRKLFSHLGRAFLPFGGTGVATRTHFILIEPAGGNTTVAANQPVTIRVHVEGHVPREIKLLTRPTQSDPEQERWLEEASDAHGDWVVTVNALDVKNGFYYRVVGGDASTDEFCVTVHASPTILADKFLATYHPRPYLGQKVDRVERGQRELKDYRGTVVTLDVPTNRKLKEGQLEFLSADKKQKRVFRGQVVAGDDTALHLQFPLEASGSYLILFKTTDGEYYSDPQTFPVVAIEDRAPHVELKKPGKDETLAADALLDLEGVASDDVGVKEVTLRLKVVGGAALQPKPYRSVDELRLADGGFPHVIDYKDFLDLAAVKDAEGKLFVLKPGVVLEYWLEARDDCDFPKPNVGASKHFKVTIAEPQRNPQKKEQQRKQAEQEKKDHQKKQDEKNKQENQERRKQENEQKKANEKAKQDGKEGDSKKGESGKDGKPKQDGSAKDKPDQRTREQKQQDAETERKKQKLDERTRQEQEKQREKAKGKGKEGKDDKSKAKGDPQDGKQDGADTKGKQEGNAKKPNGEGKDNPDKKKGSEGKGKGQDQKDAKGNKGAGKDRGKPEGMGKNQEGSSKDDAGGKPGEKKSEGKQDAGKQPQKRDNKGSGKGKEGSQKDAGQDKGKDAGKSKPTASQGKDGGKPEADGKQQKAGSKDEAGGQPGEKQQKAAGKDGKEKGQGQQAKSDGRGAAKDKEGSQKDTGQDKGKDAGETKPTESRGKDGGKQGSEDKAAAKGGQDGKKGEQSAQGKDGARQGERDQSAERGAAKGQGQGDKKQTAEEKGAGKNESGKSEKSAAKDAGKEPMAERKQGAGKGEPKEQARGQSKGQGAGDKASAEAKPKPKGGDQGSGQDKDGGRDQLADKSKPKQDLVKGDKHGKGYDKPAEEATREDVENLANDLKNGDAQTRKDAERKLEEVKREAKDSGVQKSAEEQLGKARSEKPAATAKKPPTPEQKSGEPKQGPQKGQQTVQRKGPGRQKVPGQKKGKPQNENDLGKAKNTGGRGRQQDATPIDVKGDAPDHRHQDRAGNLLFDGYDNQIKKRILKDTGLTEQDVAKIRDLERRNPPPVDDAAHPVVRTPGKAMKTTAPQRVQGGDPTKDVTGNSDGLPPREYRDLYKEFTKRFKDR